MFFQVIIDDDAFVAAGFGGRDEVEDPLATALRGQRIGEVVGGGGGEGRLTIELEIDDGLGAQVAVEKLLSLLRSLGLPEGTQLKGVWSI